MNKAVAKTCENQSVLPESAIIINAVSQLDKHH